MLTGIKWGDLDTQITASKTTTPTKNEELNVVG